VKEFKVGTATLANGAVNPLELRGLAAVTTPLVEQLAGVVGFGRRAQKIQARELNSAMCLSVGVAPRATSTQGSMEFLRHPLYSILAVLIIGALSGVLAYWIRGSARGTRILLAAILIGIGAAFIGFHAAMLSNRATGSILMPFTITFVVSLLVSFALRGPAR
jgi:uncharacterized membrane protein YeaQ/YmgE (transglycosylase-associated protein family)